MSWSAGVAVRNPDTLRDYLSTLPQATRDELEAKVDQFQRWIVADFGNAVVAQKAWWEKVLFFLLRWTRPVLLRVLAVLRLTPTRPVQRVGRPERRARASPPTVVMLVTTLDHAGAPSSPRSARETQAA
jgi:hypothetical protein